MKLVQNISVLTSIVNQSKSGTLTVKVNDNISFVEVFEGEIVMNKYKEAFVKNMSQLNLAEITFEAKIIPKTFNLYSLIDLLWDFSKHSTSFTQTFCQDHLKGHFIGKGEKDMMYKLGKVSIDTLLVYLFFSKSQTRNLQNLISFYPYKDVEILKILVYRLFIVGQLKLLSPVAEVEKPPLESKDVLLQKLLNKISNMSFSR